jgi:hypothetical protein
MGSTLKLLLPVFLLALFFLPLGGCGCGFDCNSDNDTNDPALLTLGFSDSLPEDLKQVVLEVESITFKRSGAAEVVVDIFTVKQQGLVDVPTFKIDLLKYTGVDQLLVIEGLELEAGTYEVSIAILDAGINNSYVQEADNSLKSITVSGGKLTLTGLRLSPGKQPFTVEFGLAQSLQFQSGTDKYLLATNGIRIENNLTAATLSGLVNSALFDTVSPCTEKNPPTAGNRIYLYKGIDITNDRLADVFTTGSTDTPPTDALAPFAIASLKEANTVWSYAFGYLPAGDYTLAFACDTEDDDAVEYNGLLIPWPANQVYKMTLSQSEKAVCNLAVGASC